MINNYLELKPINSDKLRKPVNKYISFTET